MADDMVNGDVLVVDDEKSIRDALALLLESEGFRVRKAVNGEAAIAACRAAMPSIILVDVMMPKMNGFTFCAEFRKMNESVPVLFLTAKDGEVDKVRGLDLGADDFISKPWSDAELLARIRRALSRYGAWRKVSENQILKIGSVEVDLTSQRAFIGGEEVRFTTSECAFMRTLCDADGAIVAYDAIYESMLSWGCAQDPSWLRILVSRLKKKLGRSGALIVNERNVGYRLV